MDLGGIDGLLHVSEMSWSRIKHPSEVVRNGQELDVMILKLRLDQGRISLGLRQILPDPWTEIGDKYHVGDPIKVTVSRLVPFGAFVTLEEGVEAIIPNSELSDRRVAKPSDVVNPGDEVEARIIEVRPDERKMTLSIRRMIESTTPREPYVPEPEMGGVAGGRGRGGRERDRDRETEGGPAGPPREGGGPRPARPASGVGVTAAAAVAAAVAAATTTWSPRRTTASTATTAPTSVRRPSAPASATSWARSSAASAKRPRRQRRRRARPPRPTKKSNPLTMKPPPRRGLFVELCGRDPSELASQLTSPCGRG